MHAQLDQLRNAVYGAQAQAPCQPADGTEGTSTGTETSSDPTEATGTASSDGPSRDAGTQTANAPFDQDAQPESPAPEAGSSADEQTSAQ